MATDAPWDIRGKTAVVTGGNTGIGRATALELARRGAEVVLTARDAAKGAATEAALTEELARARLDDGARPGTVAWMPLDLGELASIAAFARELQARHAALHVLVHNAGVVLQDRRETVDGFEQTFGVNHLGPFMLTRLLRDRLVASAPARVVVVASAAHFQARKGLDLDDLQSREGYQGVQAYARSKLANVLFTRALAARLEGTGVTANCLHPGVVATEFTRDGDHEGGLWGLVFRWARPFLLSPERGARTSVHLCCAPELADTSGEYFVRCRPATPSGPARDPRAAEDLWAISEALCRATSPDPVR